jgi:hypothetical protein
MCRNIKRLREPHGRGHATDQEIREAALQFIRKVSGFQAPSARHEQAFSSAVDEVADSSKRLLDAIETTLRSRA